MRKLLLFSIILTLGIVSTQVFAQSAFSAQADYYLKLDGIKGSVSTEGREGWILLDAVKYGESGLDNLIKSVRTVNRDIKQLDTLGLTFEKQVDKSSLMLFDALTSGKNIGAGEINMCDDSQCALKLSLSNIRVTDYNINATNTDSIQESIKIKFSFIGLPRAAVGSTGETGSIGVTGSTGETGSTDKTGSAKETSSPGEIPGWIKNNAKWFADGSIGESDFTKGIEYMIKEKIMKISKLPDVKPGASETKVPDWIKNNAKWWSEGQIDDNSFVQGIQYLVEHGIIRVN
jgi:type VI protein secretion system component Hcp